MQPVPVWLGAVKDGKLRLQARALFDRYVRRFENQPVQLTVKKLARPKTRSQLGYLWGVIYPVIADELGYREYEIDALHDAIMRELRGLKDEPNPLHLRKSLSDMSLEEVREYIDDVRFWAADKYGIVTPDAEKVEV